MEENTIVFYIGPLGITSIVTTTWGIMLVLGFICWFATRNLSLKPGLLQTALEGIISAMEAGIAAVLPGQARQLLPFIATLWIFIVVANLTGLIPELNSPTANLSVTAGLAILVFFIRTLVWHPPEWRPLPETLSESHADITAGSFD